VAWDLFNKVQWHGHCLNIVLEEERDSSQSLHPRGHQFHLPIVVPLSPLSVPFLTVVCLNLCSSLDVYIILCFAFTFVLCNKRFT